MKTLEKYKSKVEWQLIIKYKAVILTKRNVHVYIPSLKDLYDLNQNLAGSHSGAEKRFALNTKPLGTSQKSISLLGITPIEE